MTYLKLIILAPLLVLTGIAMAVCAGLAMIIGKVLEV
jgi:hypothetical protein